MADLTCKQDRQDSFYRNFNSQRTCVRNSKTLTLNTAYNISLENSGRMRPVALTRLRRRGNSRRRRIRQLRISTFFSPEGGKEKRKGEKRGPQSQEIGENMDLSISMNFNNTRVLWLPLSK